MQVIRGTPERGLMRMHVLTYLILCGFQRGVPRTIGRTIRGTPSNGAKIIDMFSCAASEEFFAEQTEEGCVSYAASEEVVPKQSHEHFGERYPMA